MQTFAWKILGNADTTSLLSNIEDLKYNLDNISTNIDDINKLISYLKDIISSIDNSKNDKNSMDLSLYYTLYIEKQNIISERDLRLEVLLGKIYKQSTFNVPKVFDEKEQESFESKNLQSPAVNKSLLDINNSLEENASTKNTVTVDHPDNNMENKNNENIQNAEVNFSANRKTESNSETLCDNNTLTISETQNKVFLPYKISDLELILKENPEKYSSLQDVINNNYIIPLSRYKNSTLSRFKEAFNLMREKEKESFSKSLDLALEVAFKYNLNPAIITACKNLDELDVYLDCLDDMTLNNFKIFDIKYDIPPMKI